MKKYIIGLFILVLLEILGVSFLACWREWFWNSISNKDMYKFILYLSEFSIVVLALVAISGYKSFLINYIGLLQRNKLTNKALIKVNQIEGYQQRIQEDCRDYPALSISLLVGLSSSSLQALVYIYIILQKISLIPLLIVSIYTFLGTYIASKIAKPLIKLNYNNQIVEARFRQELSNYSNVFDNNLAVFKRLKYLQYFQSFYNQITIIIPLLILSPNYFGGLITFGILMQLSSCIGSLIDSGSYFINSFDSINRWLSCKKRLKEMGII